MRRSGGPAWRLLVLIAAALFVSVAVVVPSAPAAPVVSSPPWMAWVSETAESNYVADMSFALDSADGMHVASGGDWQGEHQSIMHAKSELVGWSSSRIARGMFPSIAIDSKGDPHIAYVTAEHTPFVAHNGVWFASYNRSSGDWSFELVEYLSGPAFGTRFVLDAQDKPHIVYEVYTNGRHEVRYATLSGSSWVVERVDDVGFYYFGLAVDSQGRPHLTYYTATTPGNLGYAVRVAPGEWSRQVVANDAGLVSSIVLDAQDQPHIAYVNKIFVGVSYAARAGGTWTHEAVTTAGATYLGIDVDSSGEPHIAYRTRRSFSDSPLTGHIIYATRGGLDGSDAWTRESLVDYNTHGYDVSLVIGSDDLPRIGYLADENKIDPRGGFIRDAKVAYPVAALGARYLP